MAFEKLRMKSRDLSDELVEALRRIAPEVVTEAIQQNGNYESVVDLDRLAVLLGEMAAGGSFERYHLDWPGKRAAFLEANRGVTKTLRPSKADSVDFDTTKNLLIEGDNLDALKILRESYLGKIDIIYIDPPYNTGTDLIYKDNFSTSQSKYEDEAGEKTLTGERLCSNTQTNGRFHSDWLSMISPRLKLARQFLSDRGLIFISIDDNERANLQKVCEEIFGGDNFVGCFVWKRRSGAMDAVTNLSEDHEYILVYSKSNATLNGVQRTFENYSNPDNDPRGPWISDNLTAGKPGGDTYYAITDPKTGQEYFPPKGRYWPYSRQTMAVKISEGRVLFPRSGTGTPMLKRFAEEAVKPTIPVSSWIERSGASDGQSTLTWPMNSSATRELKELFGEKLFPFPKPVGLVQALIQQGGASDSVVMDFFAGSGTTGQAVMACNRADGGNRKFILVQIQERLEESSDAFKAGFRTIVDLTKERVRRAGLRELSEESNPTWNRDVGFRVLKVDSSNMADVYYSPDAVKQDLLAEQVDNIRYGRTPEDLLFQVLLDWGVDLSLPIRQETISGKAVFFVDDTALAACFDLGVDEAFVKTLAGHKPLRVVFRDAGFANDSVKINVEQLFKLLSPATEIKTI